MQNAESIFGEDGFDKLVRANDSRALRSVHHAIHQSQPSRGKWDSIKFFLVWAGVIAFCIAVWCLVFACISNIAQADEIDLDKIVMIESSGNRHAHNKKDDSRGLHQITPICLKEYNAFHPRGQRHTMDDLWNASVNSKIARWYFEIRLPKMLRHYGIKNTIRNRIIAWNAGISYLVKGKRLPETTKKYLKKYGV